MKSENLLLVLFFTSALAACGGGGSSAGGGGAISATATTTAQNLTTGITIASFTPLTASGGTSPYTYSHSDTLPVGLNFNASTGAVTGTPTAAYATTSIVFSVKDANNSVATTTSAVNITVATGAGIALSGTLGGYNSLADTHFEGTGYVPGALTVTTANSYGWIDSTGAVAAIVYVATTASTPEHILFEFGAYYGVQCGINSSYLIFSGAFQIPACIDIGITFDRVAGTISFTSTPLRGNHALFMNEPILATATGTLSFVSF